MAAGGPVEELCEEATCAICLDYFSDPVTIAECGHNFCRACLTRSWGASGAEASCPQCRATAQPGSLQANQQLAKFAEICKQLALQQGKGAEEEAGEKGVCQKHQEPLMFYCRDEEAPLCAVCSRSKVHKDHEVTPLEKKKITAIRKESVCQKHQKPLKLFCRDDEVPICMACDGSNEHRYHEILPLEEASEEYKDQFHNCLEILRKEREKILPRKADALKKSQGLLKQTTGEQQKTVTMFREMHTFLDEQEKRLLSQMEEIEKEVARERDQFLAGLFEALSSRESLIQEMEEKCEQPAGDLLQDVRSTLQREVDLPHYLPDAEKDLGGI